MTKKRQINNVLQLQNFNATGSQEVNSLISPASIAACWATIPGVSTVSAFLCNN